MQIVTYYIFFCKFIQERTQKQAAQNEQVYSRCNKGGVIKTNKLDRRLFVTAEAFTYKASF